MLLLLPPSEGKTRAAPSARPVDLDALSRPGLTDARRAVLDALVRTSGDPEAVRLLGVGASLAGEVARNTRLRDEPAADVTRVYSGVLFAASGLASLRGTARRRARGHVVVVSALWGALSPGDRIPAYRLAMGTDLPGVGPLAAHWRGPLAATLADEVDGLVVDCRSAPYAAAWRPGGGAAEVTVAVRVTSGGVVVSHHAKHARGELVNHLLTRPDRLPRSPHELAEAAAGRFDVSLDRAGAGWSLELRTG